MCSTNSSLATPRRCCPRDRVQQTVHSLLLVVAAHAIEFNKQFTRYSSSLLLPMRSSSTNSLLATPRRCCPRDRVQQTTPSLLSSTNNSLLLVIVAAHAIQVLEHLPHPRPQRRLLLQQRLHVRLQEHHQSVPHRDQVHARPHASDARG